MSRRGDAAGLTGEIAGYLERGKQQEQATWIQFHGPGDLKAKVEKLRRSGHYEVVEIYAMVGDQGYLLESDEMLEFEDSCVLKVAQTSRGAFEDEIPEIEDHKENVASRPQGAHGVRIFSSRYQ